MQAPSVSMESSAIRKYSVYEFFSADQGEEQVSPYILRNMSSRAFFL